MSARQLNSTPAGDVNFNNLIAVGLFSDIKHDLNAMHAFAAIMTRRKFATGETIIQEGNPGSEMFVLIEGRVAVSKCPPSGGDEYKVAILKAESHPVFGEGGLIESEARTATIRADTECSCLVLNRKTFEDFSAANPQWALPIYRKIAHGVMTRLRKTNNDMLLLYNALVAEIRGK